MDFQNGVLSLFECDHFCPTIAVLGLLAISGMQCTASACHIPIDTTTY